MLDVAFARLKGIDLGLIDVNAKYLEALPMKTQYERQPHIAKPDDANAGAAACNFFDEIGTH